MQKKELLENAEKLKHDLHEMIAYDFKKTQENRGVQSKKGTKFDISDYYEDKVKKSNDKFMSNLDDYLKNIVDVKTTKDEILENDMMTLLEFKKRLKTPSKSEDKLQLMKEFIDFIDLMPAFKPSARSTEKALNIEIRSLNLPLSIRPEITLDFNELTRCFNNGLFKSCFILCERIQKVSLQRKYYEQSGRDLLENDQGMSLGTMIQKLKEEEVMLDKSLSERIRMMEAIRIAPIDKKTTPFAPGRDETYEAILLTMELIKNLYRERA